MRRVRALLLVGALLTAACGSTADIEGGSAAGPLGSAGGGLGPATATTVLGATAVDGAAAPVPGARASAGPGGSATQPVAPGQTVPPAPASAIPATGPGWDEDTVFIGLTTQKDVQGVAQGLGVTSLDPGDQELQARAVVDELNRRGGLFGRKIELVFKDQQTVATAQTPDAAGESACVYFTQDNPVVALLNPVTLMDVPSFRACMANAQVPLFSASVAAVDAQVGAELAPYFYQSVAPHWDALAPVLVEELEAAGWFGAWDAARGQPLPAGTPKIGILAGTTDVEARVLELVKAQFEEVAPDVVTVQADGDFSAAVLQFRGNGVTHVVAVNADLVAFQIAAASQEYRPRYGITSVNAPQVFLESVSPEGQNRGAIGVGWSPSLDTNESNDPGPTGPAEAECLDILAKGGNEYGGKRFAEAVGFAFCDGLRLIADGANAGGGLDGPSIAAGIQRVAASFGTAFSFANGLGPDRFFLPGGVRRLAFDDECRCFRYAGTTTLRL